MSSRSTTRTQPASDWFADADLSMPQAIDALAYPKLAVPQLEPRDILMLPEDKEGKSYPAIVLTVAHGPKGHLVSMLVPKNLDDVLRDPEHNKLKLTKVTKYYSDDAFADLCARAGAATVDKELAERMASLVDKIFKPAEQAKQAA